MRSKRAAWIWAITIAAVMSNPLTALATHSRCEQQHQCVRGGRTEWAPWHIIPADNKCFTTMVVADVIIDTLQSLTLSYPVVSEEHRRHLLEAKELVGKEPS